MRSDIEDNSDLVEVDGNDSSDDFSSDTFTKMTGKTTMHACPYPGCGFMFSKVSRLETHKRIHTGERPYACKEPGCNRAYCRPEHLKRHVTNSHIVVVNDENSIASNKLQELFQCESCPKNFRSKWSLRKHEKIAHSVAAKRYPCDTCGQTFSKKSWLNCHIAKHNGELPHKCLKCGKSFSARNRLDRHMSTHEYKCETCNIEFQKFSELRKHKSQAHNSKDRKTCPICKLEFRSRSQLRQHYVTHSDVREVFKCNYPMCSRTYFHERNLRQHVQAYHEQQRFSCNFEGCDAKLATRRAMIRHMKKLHEDLPVTKPKKVCKSKPHKKQPKLPIAAMLTGAFLPRNVEREIIVEGKTFELCLPELNREVEALNSHSEQGQQLTESLTSF